MKKLFMFPYKLGSESAKTLGRTLQTKLVKSDGKYKPYTNHIVVNWGNSKTPVWWQRVQERNVTVLNSPEKVAIASNKLSTFQALMEHGIAIPEFTTSKEVAKQWTQDEKVTLCRTILNGHSGQGIVVAQTTDQVVDAPLYTQLIKKGREFRVHVFKGKVIDYIQKKRRNETEVDDFIRSYENGWVFVRETAMDIQEVKDVAVEAIDALDLDFGAIDVVWKNDMAFVLEVNTAIGMEGTTVDRYTESLKTYVNNLNNTTNYVRPVFGTTTYPKVR